MGLRRAADHAEIAFSASWSASRTFSGENWSPLPGVSACVSQKESSLARDSAISDQLISQAPNARERQRLRRLKCEHAGAWVSAVPSSIDGVDTIMKPRNFRVAVAVRLGVPVPSC